MTQPHVAPYGSWKSPITSDLIVTATVGLGQVALDGADTYWVELRPSEGGRNCIVRRTPDGRLSDVTPQGFNARTRVHEYGGIALSLARQERPDTSAYDDPEIVYRVDKPHHVGLVVRSPDLARVRSLLEDYSARFARDFSATVPPPERRGVNL